MTGRHGARSLEIVNARLRDRDGLWRIVVDGERIAAVEPQLEPHLEPGRSPGPPGPGAGGSSDSAAGEDRSGPSAPGSDAPRRIDAAGGLVTEGFVNGHLHLCKVNTLDLLGDDALREYHAPGMGGAMTAIERAAAVKNHYRQDLLVPGIRRAVERAIAYGGSHIRAFADTDTTARLEGVRAVMQVRDEFRDRIEIQVVAFPQDGVIRDPGAAELVRDALEEGADVVGGIPWIEFTDAAARDHIEAMLDLAVRYDRPVSMLVDDAGEPNLRTLEILAVETIHRGLQGRVTAQHARAMALYPEPSRLRLFGLLREARIGIVSDPHTGPLHADIDGLQRAGIPVALGQDDIVDAYYPFGRNNMLEVAFLAAHLLWKTDALQISRLCDMIGVDAANVLGILDHTIAPGAIADINVHRGTTPRELLQEHEAPRYVMHRGRIVAQEGSLR
jgi:cytosine deaminase